MGAAKSDIIAKLQSEILRLEGFKPAGNIIEDAGLKTISEVFPNKTFPSGAIHEFIIEKPDQLACTTGFIGALLSALMKDSGICLWISTARNIFPPALKRFGVQPHRVIFIDLQKEEQVLWALDEAFKCSVLSAVVGEVRDLSFTGSRRLQLAVEKSHVNGFIIRYPGKKINTTACQSRWRIKSLPSDSVDDLPGMGFPKWRVEILRMRNGKTGIWDFQLMGGKLFPLSKESLHQEQGTKKAG